MARRQGLTWRAKLALLLSAFALIPLVAGTYWSVREQAKLAERQTLIAMEALVRAKAEAVDQFADFRKRDVERMATLLAPYLVALADAKLANEEHEEIPPEQLPGLEDAEEAPGSEAEPDDDQGAEQPPADGDTDGPASPSEQPEGPGDSGADGEPEGAPSPPGDSDPEESKAKDSKDARADRDDQKPKGNQGSSAKNSEKGSDDPPEVQEAKKSLRRAVSLIAWDLEEFEEILILDPQGRVIVSTFEKHEGHSAKELRYFDKGLRGTYLEPVFLSTITGELTMVIATPILDEDRNPTGVVAARLNLKRFFRLLNDTTGLGKSGETVAGRVVKDEVVFTAPTRHDPDAALRTRVGIGQPFSKPLQEAARGNNGAGKAVDYRGLPVLAAWHHVPSLEWGLVVKMDEAEALAAVEEATREAVVGGAFVVLLGIVAALLVSRFFVRPLRDLQGATERISRGDFDVSLSIQSNDEIGELADSFERMVAAIKFFKEHSRPADEEELEPDELEADAPVSSPPGEDGEPDSPKT